MIFPILLALILFTRLDFDKDKNLLILCVNVNPKWRQKSREFRALSQTCPTSASDVARPCCYHDWVQTGLVQSAALTQTESKQSLSVKSKNRTRKHRMYPIGGQSKFSKVKIYQIQKILGYHISMSMLLGFSFKALFENLSARKLFKML